MAESMDPLQQFDPQLAPQTLGFALSHSLAAPIRPWVLVDVLHLMILEPSASF